MDLAEEELEPGQYVVQAYVDRSSLADPISVATDEGNVEEHNETNNLAELVLTLIGEPGPEPEPEPDPDGADLALRYPQMRAKPSDIRAYAQVFNLGEESVETVEVLITVMDADGLIIAQHGPVQNVDTLLPGRSVFVATRFFEGVDYVGAIPLGTKLTLVIELLTPDTNPEENRVESEATVLD